MWTLLNKSCICLILKLIFNFLSSVNISDTANTSPACFLFKQLINWDFLFYISLANDYDDI
jgi:hypothetical protein